MYLEQTTLVCLHLTLLGFFLISNSIFIITDQCRSFTSGKSPDILINAIEDFATFFVWAPCILHNLYLQQKQRYSVWSFTKNAGALQKIRGRLAHLVSLFACNTRVIVDASSKPPVSCLKLL